MQDKIKIMEVKEQPVRTLLKVPELIFNEVSTSGYEPQYELKLKRYNTDAERSYHNPSIVITQSPFYNCQIYTIGGFANLIEDYYISNEIGVKKTLELIQETVGKSRLVIDITNYNRYTSVVEDIFKDDIVFKQEYRNNTGSDMVMYMLRTEPIGYVEENDDYEDYDEDNF